MEALIPIGLLLLAFLAVVSALTRYRAARASGRFGARDIPEDALVLVADAWGEANAQIMLDSLRAAGIDAVAKAAMMLPRYGSIGWGRHRVYVRRRDLRQARAALGYPPLEHLEV